MNLLLNKYLLIIILISSCFTFSIKGPARVIDGDSIIINEVSIRLEGIDAPEVDQICEGKEIGLLSITYLTDLIGNSEIECLLGKNDKFGRLLATCFKDSENINSNLVITGHAFVDRLYSSKYLEEEQVAMKNNTPIWMYKCHEPYVHRIRKNRGKYAKNRVEF
jgi:endonuclease YncB( thermonuclease family)